MDYPTKATFENDLMSQTTIQIRNVMPTHEDEIIDHCIEIDIDYGSGTQEWTLMPKVAFVLMELLCEHFDYEPRRIDTRDE